MKKLLIFILLTVSICHAGDNINGILQDGGKIERDFFDKSKLNIIDSNYKRTGTIERDFFDKRKLNIYDSDHRKIGTIERDYWNKDKWNIKRGK